jgi:hypothetical protein
LRNKVIRRRPVTPAAPADSWEGFLAPPDDEEDYEEDYDLEPPPFPAELEKAAPPPQSVIDLGSPPDDAVGAAKWAYTLHMRLAHHAMMDATMTPSQRRKEVRITLAGAAKHMMDALRYDVVQTIEKERQAMEAKKRGRAAAKTEKRGPAPAGAKIIPIRRDG